MSKMPKIKKSSECPSTFLFYVEGAKSKSGRKIGERGYIEHLFAMIKDKLDVSFHKDIINKSKKGTIQHAITDIERFLSEASNRAYVKNKSQATVKKGVYIFLLLDKDMDSNKAVQIQKLKSACTKKGYRLFLSNACFETFLNMHLSQPKKKEDIEKDLSDLTNQEFWDEYDLCRAYQKAKSNCMSAEDNCSDPFCLEYNGSDLFSFLDILKNSINEERYNEMVSSDADKSEETERQDYVIEYFCENKKAV